MRSTRTPKIGALFVASLRSILPQKSHRLSGPVTASVRARKENTTFAVPKHSCVMTIRTEPRPKTERKKRMNPYESPATFKFLHAVYDGEKEALEHKIVSLAKTVQESEPESIEEKKIMTKLQDRLAILTEYRIEESDKPFIFKFDGKAGIACPRCLVHTGKPRRMSVYAQMPNGELELRCKQCELETDATRYLAPPPPTVPL